ncbi:MAG: VWA domain-containing protein [Muribaculaceae bacterium]|nr:VWA domain-containing protein [Muribaculaceae bacterium]MCM1440498.1 VWA domain-containing protein [Roseburia sp.]
MANDIFGTKRNIDVVFCIDGTGSMAPCIESVKSNARRFHLEFVSAMTDFGSEIDSMRVKVIVFRDYHDDGEQAMVESPFFELPTDTADFEKFLADVSANGGGDNPENGLEALYYAMKSDFTAGAKDRQVIVLFTDAEALDLRERAGEANYPSDMVDEAGLIEMWACMAQDSSFKLRDRNKRLVMFAPDGTKYKALKSKLNRSVFEPVNMADGLGDIDFKEIIKIIAASASNA